MGTPVTVKIKFKSDTVDQFIDAYAADVSEGGIFIRTPRPLSTGTHLTFHFQLKDGSPLLTGNGTVVWVREPGPDLGDLSAGMGVRFDSLPAEGQAIVDRIVSHKQEVEQFADELPTRVAPETTRNYQEHEQAVAQSSPEIAADEVPGMAQAQAPAHSTGPEAAQEPADSSPETEEDRRDRLEKILFSSQDEIKTPEEPAGALPISEGEEDSAQVTTASAPYAGGARQQKSSPIGWIVVALMAVGAAVAYYFLVMQKQAVPEDTIEITSPGRADPAPAPATPEPVRVTVKVESTPENARIWLDGTDTGKTTPAELTDLDPEREVEIGFDLPGKKLVVIKQKPSAEAPIAAALEQDAKRSVAVESIPEGATVILNGRRIGKTPLVYDKTLREGRSYSFVLRLRGHKSSTTKVKLQDLTWDRDDAGDEVFKISQTLEPTAPRPAATPRTAPRDPVVRPKATPKPVAPKPVTPKAAAPKAAAPKAAPAPAPKPAPAKPAADAPAPKPEGKKPSSIKLPSWGE